MNELVWRMWFCVVLSQKACAANRCVACFNWPNNMVYSATYDDYRCSDRRNKSSVTVRSLTPLSLMRKETLALKSCPRCQWLRASAVAVKLSLAMWPMLKVISQLVN